MLGEEDRGRMLETKAGGRGRFSGQGGGEWRVHQARRAKKMVCSDIQKGGGRAWEGFFLFIRYRRRELSINSGKCSIAYPAIGSDVLRVGGPLHSQMVGSLSLQVHLKSSCSVFSLGGRFFWSLSQFLHCLNASRNCHMICMNQ